MPQTYHVKLSDGREFNVDTEGGPPSEADILTHLGGSAPAAAPPAPTPTWSDKLGLNTGTASVPVGFVKGAASGAVDMAQGVSSNIANQLKALGSGLLQTADTEAGAPPQDDAALGRHVPDVPPTFSGEVGNLLPDVAALTYGGGKAVEAIPRTARAAKGFEEVMNAARDLPVNVEAPGKVALRVMDLAERGGGSLPTPVRQFANWITNPKKEPMSYEIARDFASGISKLSVNEFQRMGPNVAREVAGLRVALNDAVLKTAAQVGKAKELDAAMKEYAQAKRLKDAVDTAVSGAKKALPYAVAGGAAGAVGTGSYWLTKELRSLLGGE